MSSKKCDNDQAVRPRSYEVENPATEFCDIVNPSDKPLKSINKLEKPPALQGVDYIQFVLKVVHWLVIFLVCAVVTTGLVCITGILVTDSTEIVTGVVEGIIDISKSLCETLEELKTIVFWAMFFPAVILSFAIGGAIDRHSQKAVETKP